MTEKELQDVLAKHADGLNRDEELGELLLARNQEQAGDLAPLLQLASALKVALKPVSAPVFQKKLGNELVNYGPPVVVLGRSVSKRRGRAWFAVAAAGSLISVAGVTALFLRRVRPHGNGSVNSKPDNDGSVMVGSVQDINVREASAQPAAA
jgi:hypothetical protein